MSVIPLIFLTRSFLKASTREKYWTTKMVQVSTFYSPIHSFIHRYNIMKLSTKSYHNTIYLKKKKDTLGEKQALTSLCCLHARISSIVHQALKTNFLMTMCQVCMHLQESCIHIDHRIETLAETFS